jgi:hypothetical protein
MLLETPNTKQTTAMINTSRTMAEKRRIPPLLSSHLATPERCLLLKKAGP